MSLRQNLTYLVQAVVLGLAIAFVVLYVWPEITGQAPSTVEIRQTAPEPATQSVGGPYSYATAVDRASSAVVNINTAKVITVRPHPFFDDPIFRQFFGGADNLITPRKRVETSLGSGVIMSAQGIILTNHHVIRGADAIQVSLQDGRMVQAKVVGSDPETDIAVLKIDLKKLPVITLGHSDKLRVGDVVLAIGNPFGVGQTVTMGIVSATGRNKLGINTFLGNSGGALIDAEGNLVGINTAIFSRSGGNQGIGFAIPTSLAQNVMEEIIKHGRPQRGWLGIEAQVITPQIARALELKDTKGVVVVGVVRNGPAHKAGLQPGDVLVSIDGKKINEAREALLNISSHKPGSVVKLGILREGKSMMLQATAIERPARTAATE